MVFVSVANKVSPNSKHQSLPPLLCFHGRSTRGEYWSIGLMIAMVYVVAMLIDASIFSMAMHAESNRLSIPWASLIFIMGATIPTLALNVRRLHDRGKSGWFLFLALIPLIGTLWLLVECGLLGSKHKNNTY